MIRLLSHLEKNRRSGSVERMCCPPRLASRLILLLMLLMCTVDCEAEGFLGDFTPLLPVPTMRGEASCHVGVVSIVKGSQTLPGQGMAWDLRNDFGLRQPEFSLDAMARIQIGRVSFRVNYDLRDFSSKSPRDPTFGGSSLDCSALRLGADLDAIQWCRGRIGLNADYALAGPSFTEPAAFGGQVLGGGNPGTIGFHGHINPTHDVYGFSGLLDLQARWSFFGTQLTDWEISGGILSPDTMLGNIGLKAGYRQTNLSLHQAAHNGISNGTNIDVTFAGWFGELVYKY